MGARDLITPGLTVNFPFGFPALAGKVRVQRLQLLARAIWFTDPLSGAPRHFESRRSLIQG